MKRWTIFSLAAFLLALGSALAAPWANQQEEQSPLPKDSAATGSDASQAPEPGETNENLFVGNFVEIYSRSDPDSTILLKNARRGILCGQEFITGEGIDVGAERGDEWMEGRRVWHAAGDVSLIIEFADEDDYLGALERQMTPPADDNQRAICFETVCEASPQRSNQSLRAEAVVASVGR